MPSCRGGEGREMTQVAFWLFAVLGGALFILAAIFVLLDAQFIAALQVMVYAGAIMVLFLFVIMLLNLGRERATDMRGWAGRLVALGRGVLLVGELWGLGG